MKPVIIWLDVNSSDPKSDFCSKLGDAQTFIEVKSCVDYIRSRPNQCIYLIVSGSLVKETVPQIYELSNVIQIFVFCGSILPYIEWAMDYFDKLMMFDHGDDLLERLWNDIEKNLRTEARIYLERAEEFKQRALRYKQAPCG